MIKANPFVRNHYSITDVTFITQFAEESRSAMSRVRGKQSVEILSKFFFAWLNVEQLYFFISIKLFFDFLFVFLFISLFAKTIAKPFNLTTSKSDMEATTEFAKKTCSILPRKEKVLTILFRQQKGYRLCSICLPCLFVVGEKERGYSFQGTNVVCSTKSSEFYLLFLTCTSKFSPFWNKTK